MTAHQICIFRTLSTQQRIQAEKKTISSKDASHLELHKKKIIRKTSRNTFWENSTRLLPHLAKKRTLLLSRNS
jgi:hypothetical protein